MPDYIKEIRKMVGHFPLLMPGALVILINEDKEILMQKRADMDIWGIPGGFCELGETIEETARREVFEEVGLECKDLKLLNVYSGQKYYFKYSNGDEVYNVTLTFICKEFGGTLNLDINESTDAKYFTLNEALDIAIPALKDILFDYAKYENIQI